MSLLLIAIFKNESNIIEEWIEHYINEGVDCLLLIDNGSTDNYERKIQKYIDTGFLLLHKNPKKYAQAEIYNDCIECARKFDWVIIADLDEFIYARNGFSTIKDYLNSLDASITQIHIPWKMFGSSDHLIQPDSVIQNFTWRQEYINPTTILAKSIFKGNKIKKIDIHRSILKKEKGNKDIFSNNQMINKPFDGLMDGLTEDFLDNSYLHINHYAIQSWEYFKNIKMTRGDINDPNHNGTRNKQYFDSYNHKQMEDEELKNKKYDKKYSVLNYLYNQNPNILKKNIEIVVSRYNENLDWIHQYPFNQFEYIVYNKGFNEKFNKKNVKKVISLPNVGVCDHTYLYHIVSNYDSCSLRPITIFFPGSVNMPNKINKAIEILNKVL